MTDTPTTRPAAVTDNIDGMEQRIRGVLRTAHGDSPSQTGADLTLLAAMARKALAIEAELTTTQAALARAESENEALRAALAECDDNPQRTAPARDTMILDTFDALTTALPNSTVTAAYPIGVMKWIKTPTPVPTLGAGEDGGGGESL